MRHSHLKEAKHIIGTVTSNKMDRTVVVSVSRYKLNTKYLRVVQHWTKYFCHDHHSICGIGDRVLIKPCQQLSKKKRWTVVDMIARYPQLAGEQFLMSRLRINPTTGQQSVPLT